MVMLVDSTTSDDPFTELFDSEDTSEEAIRGVIEDMKSRYRFRTVRTPNELMEKIAVFEAGMDDRVIEVIKQGILAADEKDRIEHLWFAPTENGPALLVEEEQGFTDAMPIDKNLYETVETEYAPLFDDRITRIDEEWARSLLVRAS